MKSPMTFKPLIPATLVRILGVVVVAALLVGAVIQVRPGHSAQATAGATCTSIGDGDWNNSANWDCGAPGVYPDVNDSAVIDGHVITVSADQAVKDVSVAANASLTISDGVKLTVGGSLHVISATSLVAATFDQETSEALSGGTLEFGPGGDQLLDTGGAWLRLWNLTKTGSGSLTVESCTADRSGCDGGFEVFNQLTLGGVDPQYVKLRSAMDGVTWEFLAHNTPAIDYVDVSDSTNTGALISVDHGINSGNNSGWRFLGLSAVPNPSLVEQDVTFTLALPDGATDTSVTFKEGLLNLVCQGGNPASVVDGSASCVTGNLSAGSHIITVSYIGGSAQVTQVVTAATNLDLDSSQSPSVVNTEVTFSAKVMPMTAGAVTFDDGDNPICAGVTVDANGVASCKVALNSTGTHTITAEFLPASPDAESSQSAPLSQQVKNLSAVSVGVDNTPIIVGQSVTLTATVTSSPAATGTITFLENGNFIAGCSNIALSAKTAQCVASGLGFGKHDITVQYSGDDVNFSSVSSPAVMFVNKAIYLPIASSASN